MQSDPKEEPQKSPEEIGLEPNSSSVRTSPPERAPEVVVQPEKKSRSIGRLLLIGLGLAAVFFLAGVLVVYFSAVRPRVDEIRSLEEKYSQDTSALEDQIGDLQSQVDELEDKNSDLTNNNEALTDLNDSLVDQTRLDSLHVSLLMALNDITSARMALAGGDLAGARLALSNTDATLEELKMHMTADTQDVVAQIQADLADMIDFLDQPPARDDLLDLENRLKDIENRLFIAP